VSVSPESPESAGSPETTESAESAADRFEVGTIEVIDFPRRIRQGRKRERSPQIFNKWKSKADYGTPKVFIGAVENAFGGRLDFDLAAHSENTKCGPNFFDEAKNSLVQNWGAITVEGRQATRLWLNPPFSHVRPWVEKAMTASASDKELQIFVLLTAAVGTKWFKYNVFGKAMIYFLDGRIIFDGQEKPAAYPKDCMLVHYGVPPGFAIWKWGLDANRDEYGESGHVAVEEDIFSSILRFTNFLVAPVVPMEPWVRIEDLNRYLGITSQTTYDWIKHRGLPARQFAREWKFRMSEVVAWVERARRGDFDEEFLREEVQREVLGEAQGEVLGEAQGEGEEEVEGEDHEEVQEGKETEENVD
jgi:phage N-6-adenine-methyltransferase